MIYFSRDIFLPGMSEAEYFFLHPCREKGRREAAKGLKERWREGQKRKERRREKRWRKG